MQRVAVLGAGAAGLSAARVLAGRGDDVELYEARDRVGGRAVTDYGLASHPVEMGAEFIHGENVATWDWIREFGAETSGAAHSYASWAYRGGELVDAASYAKMLGTNPLSAVGRLTRSWVEAGRPDASLREVLGTWQEHFGGRLSAEDRTLLENLTAQVSSSDLEELGAYRGTEATYEGDGRLQHFRLLGGYSRLMDAAAAGLSIRLADSVARVEWDERGAEIIAASGRQHFDSVIVALPLGVLKRGDVEFAPGLPKEKEDAIARLNAGHINKIVLKLDRVYWPPDLTFLFTPHKTQLWWRPGQGQAAEEPVLTAFFGGRDAAEFEAMSTEEALVEATRDLGDVLGRALAGHVRDGRFIAWGAEPHTRMGYSSVPPGGLGLRDQLAAPVGCLAFAGEATNPTRPATVHGAIESGRRAAAEVIARA